MNFTDTRQAEYTELTAKCGELVYVRLEQDVVKAAEMISQFMQENCARSACPATRTRSSRNCTCYATSGHESSCSMWDDMKRSR